MAHYENAQGGFKNGDTRNLNGKVQKFYKGNWNDVKKRSGAKEVRGEKNGSVYFGISAWNFSKSRGLISASAFKNSSSKEGQSNSGKWVSLIFEIIYMKTGQKMIVPAVYSYDTGKAFIKDLNMVISTKAKNGGYFGTASTN